MCNVQPFNDKKVTYTVRKKKSYLVKSMPQAYCLISMPFRLPLLIHFSEKLPFFHSPDDYLIF